MGEPKAVIRQCCAMVAEDALINTFCCRYDVGQCVVCGLLGVYTKSGIGVVECQPPGINMQGRIQVGGWGFLGVKTPASPFWGPPKLHKEGGGRREYDAFKYLTVTRTPPPPPFQNPVSSLVCGYNGVYTFIIWIYLRP